MKNKRFERDVDECAHKIAELLTEYNCEIGVYDENCNPMANTDIDLVDSDNTNYVRIVKQ